MQLPPRYKSKWGWEDMEVGEYAGPFDSDDPKEWANIRSSCSYYKRKHGIVLAVRKIVGEMAIEMGVEEGIYVWREE